MNLSAVPGHEATTRPKKWHKVTLTFAGPETSETDPVNPFMRYRLNVRFTHRETGKSQVVPEHADQLGMFLHFKLLEQECQGLLDNGAIGAYTRLYYREMLARFGHHLALNWNVGEESGDWAKDQLESSKDWVAVISRKK